MSSIIEVTNLTKKFKEVTAVTDLSFTVHKGEVHGFLGQNGAGKSTTIRMLLTLIAPTSGVINVFGKNIETHRKEILQKVGAIIESPDLYQYLTALENLQMMAKLSGVKASATQLLQQLETVGIRDRAGSKVKTFSQGMKQRLGIACALVHNPELIVLDEPTNGLDPQGIADIRNLILQLSGNHGRTVFISSHLLSEMELIADAMLIIDKGKKIAEGKVSNLLDPANTILHIEVTNMAAARKVLQLSAWQKKVQPSNDTLQLRLHRNEIPALNKYLVGQGVDVISLTARHSLEDYFLSLTTANQHVAAYKD